jgi:branched-chain amino acid transport system permease protein
MSAVAARLRPGLSGPVVQAGLTIAGVAAVLGVGAAIMAWKLPSSRGIASLLAQSVLFGCLYAVSAVGLIVVHRASRVINFAHGGVWVVCYVLFWELFGFHGLTYWLALPATILGGALVGAAIELIFVRRFFSEARLTLTVVTIGLGQLLAACAQGLPGPLGDHDKRPGSPHSPLSHFAWQTFPVRFTGDYGAIAVLTAVSLVALGLFFRYTSLGIAVRGASQNGDRASELGINVKSLSTAVWAIAGALAGLAAALTVTVFGYNPSAAASAIGPGVLLVPLAAAVMGGMDNIPVTAAAAIVIGIIAQVAYYAFNQSAIVDLVLLILIIGGLVAQRASLGRTDESSTSTWAAADEVRPIPAELARLPVVRYNVRRGLVVLGAIALGYPFVMSPSQTNLASLVFIDGIVVFSLVILTGWGGQVSLGQYGFVAIGAFAGAKLSADLHFPFVLALLGGCLAGAAISIVLGLTALRVRGLYLAVTTLAFAIVVQTIVLTRSYLGKYIPSRVGRPQLVFIKTEDNRAYYYVCLAALAFAWWAAVGLRKSRTGRVLIATRDNERAAQAFGVNLVRARLITFALSGFMAAGAGMLLASEAHTVSPGEFAPEQSIQIFLMAIIGGLGSLQGAFLGAVYFAVVDFFVHGAIAQLLASAVGVLVVLYFFPGGIGALIYKGRDAILRRIAIRRRIWVPSLFSDAVAAAGLTNKAPLAPHAEVKEIPAKYRQPSRIRVTGASQSGPRWTYQ